MIRPVVRYPDPVLAQVAADVSLLAIDTPETNTLIQDMFDTMENGPRKGVGLAAPQIGVSQRIIVINVPEKRGHVRLALINPEIVTSAGKDLQDEGCLSLPGLYQQVERPYAVVVTFYTQEGRRMTAEFEGLPARVICHEIDHLAGKVFLDRLSRQMRRRMLAEIDKLIKSGAWFTDPEKSKLVQPVGTAPAALLSALTTVPGPRPRL